MRLTPIELHLILTWKSIAVHSESLLLDQRTLCANIAKAFKLKNEADGLCCGSSQVKLTPLVPPPEPLLSLVSGNGPDTKHF